MMVEHWIYVDADEECPYCMLIRVGHRHACQPDGRLLPWVEPWPPAPKDNSAQGGDAE